MVAQQERRNSERVRSMGACTYELTKPVGADSVKFIEGSGHSINRSIGGCCSCFLKRGGERQVLEIQVPAETRKEHITKLGEVCWTRPVRMNARVNMYLVGIRYLFEVPGSGRSPQSH